MNMYKNPLSKLVTLTRRAGANKDPQTAVIVTVDCSSFFQYVDIYHISISVSKCTYISLDIFDIFATD